MGINITTSQTDTGVDLQGLVDSISLGESRNLLPLFEAVVNSIHAIQEREIPDGKITIEVMRDGNEVKLLKNSDGVPKLLGFRITDNGSGFNARNMLSFQTAYSRHKRALGGKGFGHFTWLKTCNEVRITSNYEEDGAFFKREIEFSLPSGITRNDRNESKKRAFETTVELSGYLESYTRKNKKAQTIALKIIEHCLSYLVAPNCPKIVISDIAEEGSPISVNDLFLEKLYGKVIQENVYIKDKTFKLVHIKLKHPEVDESKIYYCANGREVFSEKLNSILPTFPDKFVTPGGETFTYSGYLMGDYLDGKVNMERSRFDIPNKSNIDYPNLICFDEIETALKKQIRPSLNKYLLAFNKRKLERLEELIKSHYPQYSYLLKEKKEICEKLTFNFQPGELEILLYQMHSKRKAEITQEANDFLEESVFTTKEQAEYSKTKLSLIERLTEVGKSDLIEYVLHRKIILNLLSKRIGVNDEGEFHYEEEVHGLICPLKADSTDIDYKKHNLWVIDERLAYHHYLASEIELEKYDVIRTKSKKRPDITIFNKPISFTETDDPSESTVIIEFKRPERGKYGDKDPIRQTYEYVEEIKAGKVAKKNGKPVRVKDHTPFYIYIVCDITDEMDKFCRFATFTKTPDAEGYYGFNRDLNAYIEVISYDKLLKDAQKRNQILFERLGLLPTS